MIKQNNAKLEFKLDEITFSMNSAMQIKEEISKAGSFTAFVNQITTLIWKETWLKIQEFENREEWFCWYSTIILQELDSFNPLINIITSKETFVTKYSKELVFYFGCVIGVSWFLDGVSWGYSSLLTHKELDEESRIALKVLFNFMIRLKRYFIH